MAHNDEPDQPADLLDADDAAEEVNTRGDGDGDGDGDVAMDSDSGEEEEQEEITLHNDSIAYFDAHNDSVFAIAQHPTVPSIIATGGSEGDADDAPGKGYVFDTSGVAGRPVLPPSYNADSSAANTPTSTALDSIFTIDGHTDSINALAFTLPRGDYLASAGLDGQLRVYSLALDAHNKPSLGLVGEALEVPEINWLAPCPASASQNGVSNTFALGASDGSVWVYTVDAGDKANPLQIVQSYFMHTGPCTAGAWSRDGTFLATASEDSSLHVWDVWGIAAAKGLANDNGQTVVSLTETDQRFAVEGGLYSVAIDPKAAFVAVGGAGGAVRIASLPRIAADEATTTAAGKQGKQGKGKAKGGDASSAGGTLLASLQTQGDGIETLAFSAGQSLLAAGSVDGSIAIYDTARRFAVRRLIQGAHEEFSVVKVDFVPGLGDGWLLTSCGMDGVVRRWDLRGGATGPVKEWRGHRGDGEGGGVLGFVQGGTGERVVTAGDDGVVLVFEA